MNSKQIGALLLAGVAAAAPARQASAQGHGHHGHHPPADTSHASHAGAGHGAPVVPAVVTPGPAHPMWMQPLGGGWSLMGMAQAFPIVTAGAPGEDDSPLNGTEFYLTQPAAMINVESPGSRVVLRTTLNFEAFTLQDGELTFGGWGEGFLDKRHPHTLLHEAMLSVNLWDVGPGALSLSAGKGFAPYGTDDPMSRPVVKYPTNHHLSQILERWTVNAALAAGPWVVEAGVFGGQEPTGPHDYSNIRSFGDSWSARLTRRLGTPVGTSAPWELSASYGSVAEAHHGEKERKGLVNGAVRHDGQYGFGRVYGLVEASRSMPEGDEDSHFSVLAETMVTRGRHQPYYRVEFATRPEYPREAASGQRFFRYDHDDHAEGASRWLINSFGYSYALTGYPAAALPFVEVQHNLVRNEPGEIDAVEVLGADSFWSLTAGFRIFLGGGPMRMGSYGVRDDMTLMHRMPVHGAGHGAHDGH